MKAIFSEVVLSFLLLAGQSYPEVSIAPATLPEQRADLALRSADDGKALAKRFICFDEQRYRRLLELEPRFAALKTGYAHRFRHAWRGESDETMAEDRSSDLGRRDDCKLRDSFEAGLADYENGLRAAETQLRTQSTNDTASQSDTDNR